MQRKSVIKSKTIFTSRFVLSVLLTCSIQLINTQYFISWFTDVYRAFYIYLFMKILLSITLFLTMSATYVYKTIVKTASPAYTVQCACAIKQNKKYIYKDVFTKTWYTFIYSCFTKGFPECMLHFYLYLYIRLHRRSKLKSFVLKKYFDIFCNPPFK